KPAGTPVLGAGVVRPPPGLSGASTLRNGTPSAGTPISSTQGSAADQGGSGSSSLTKGKPGASSVVLSLDIGLGDF
ncbi:hypothetical protein CF319_g8410, partial [Tilletia indica]